MTEAKNPIGAVQTTVEILEVLKRNGEMGITELTDHVSVSKGSVHNHLATLCDNDFVTKTGDRYQLGFRFMDFAHHAKLRVSIYDLVSQEVDNLAAKSGEMALYTQAENGMGVCLYRAMGDNAVHTPLYEGHRSELHHTAVGKAILAHMPREEVERIIEERGLQSHTPKTITDPDELFEELESIRERGFAFNREETITGLVGVGAPIQDRHGDVAGAISIIGPTSRMDENRFDREIPDMITRSINIIEINATSI
ncbi:IclR family transcriptional regulator [Haloarchaeobius sp. TZWSO28]|uniref:IclR family transcriptional regulator n=1 Tax=Haloarchaeobius sp. TZWSO28 TaxID=3446119 RepID=UPI003EBE8074